MCMEMFTYIFVSFSKLFSCASKCVSFAKFSNDHHDTRGFYGIQFKNQCKTRWVSGKKTVFHNDI